MIKNTFGTNHFLFATAAFAPGTPKEQMKRLTMPIRTAQDWFVEDLLFQWVHKALLAEIREAADLCLAIPINRIIPPEVLYGGGMTMAEAVYYDGFNRRRIPAVYRQIANVLLAVDPGKRSIAIKCKLINSLAAITCQDRVEVTKVGGVLDVLETKERDNKK